MRRALHTSMISASIDLQQRDAPASRALALRLLALRSLSFLPAAFVGATGDTWR